MNNKNMMYLAMGSFNFVAMFWFLKPWILDMREWWEYSAIQGFWNLALSELLLPGTIFVFFTTIVFGALAIYCLYMYFVKKQ